VRSSNFALTNVLLTTSFTFSFFVYLTFYNNGEKINAYRIWCKNAREREHLEDLGADGRIILKQIIKN
jgi:hypothetical protein